MKTLTWVDIKKKINQIKTWLYFCEELLLEKNLYKGHKHNLDYSNSFNKVFSDV